jgi:hypothetical protein
MSDFAKLLEMALSIQPEPQRTVTREDGVAVVVNTRNPLVGEWPGGHEEPVRSQPAPHPQGQPAHTATLHPHAEPLPAPRPGPRK